MSATLTIRNTSDVAISLVVFGNPAPGATSAEQTIRVYNSGTTAPASCYIVALTALCTYTGANNNQGQEAITEKWVQAKESGGAYSAIGGDITVAGNRLSITPPAASAYTTVVLKLVVPAGATTRGPLAVSIAAFYPVA
jgi:hypothetical protein